MSSGKFLLALFFLLSLLNLFAEFTYSRDLIFISKPLLITVLAIWFLVGTNGNTGLFRKLILGALIFSVGGDTLLMFVENDPESQHFFLLGLGSFLIAHLFYFFGFIKFPSTSKGILADQKWWILPFAGYFLLMSCYLFPDIPQAMKLPVMLYSFVIVLMAAACFNLKGKISTPAFQLVFTGVLLFIASDTIIALNKFKSAQLNIPLARLLIMGLYLSGQLLIVLGSRKMIKELA